MATRKKAGTGTDGSGNVLDEAKVQVVRNEELVQKRREQICNAALDLFLEKGFASTSIRDICAKSGVNQASIYDYVANKNDALRRLLNQLWFRADVPTLPEILADKDRDLEDILTEYFRETWDKKRKGTLLIYRTIPHLLPEDRAAMRKREQDISEEAGKLLCERFGLEPGDPRVDIMVNMLVFLTAFGPMRDWIHAGRIENEMLVRTVAKSAAAMLTSILEGETPEGF